MITKPKVRIAIFDLDGTICDDGHRKVLAERKLWDEYHAACSDDLPREAEMFLLKATAAQGVTCIAITGRTEPYRTQTMAWLQRHGLSPMVLKWLFMRGATDRRPATTVKLDILGQIVAMYEEAGKEVEVLFVVEDDARLVNMWRGMGFTCFQCQEDVRRG